MNRKYTITREDLDKIKKQKKSANYVFDKRFIPRKYEALLIIKRNNPIKKQAKDLGRHVFREDIHTASKHKTVLTITSHICGLGNANQKVRQ